MASESFSHTSKRREFTQADAPRGRRCERATHSFSCLTNFAKSCMLKRASEHAPLGRLLDLGCGRASDFSKAAYYGATSYTGVESEPIRLKQAEARLSRLNKVPILFEFLEDSIEMTCANGGYNRRFDSIVTFNALHHACPSIEDADLILQQISDILTPGGLLIVISPDGAKIRKHITKHRDVSTSRRWSFCCYCQEHSISPCTCARYLFNLKDCFEGMTEPFVDWNSVLDHCAHNFRVVHDTSLARFAAIDQTTETERQIWKAMYPKIPFSVTSSDEELAELYRCLILCKYQERTVHVEAFKS